MNTLSHRATRTSTPATLGLAVLLLQAAPGCADNDAPAEPIGQFDDGTFEIRDPANNYALIGAIFAHYDRSTLGNSFEYWVVQGSYCPGTSCALDGMQFKNTGDASVSFDRWKDSGVPARINNPSIFRATYSDHGGGGLTCQTGTAGDACAYAAKGSPTTTVSMLPPGSFAKGGAAELPLVVVQNASDGLHETWFMSSFFSGKDGEFSLTSLSGGSSFFCAACSATLKLDVLYKRCGTALPRTTSECNP